MTATLGVSEQAMANDYNKTRQEEIRESMYKILLQLSAHIAQTDCEHCKAVVKGIRE